MGIAVETLAVFIRFWLATTPALLSLRPAVAQRRGSVSIRAPAWGATPAP